MFLIIGLGNPGKQYEHTWHSLGFLAIDEFQKQNGLPNFVISRKFNSLISEGVLDDKKIILAKPQSFMNESGKFVKKILDTKYQIRDTSLIVVHDDADLEIGKMKISQNKGSAGHKGIESIMTSLKSKTFVRIRLGSRPKNYRPGSKSLEKFVLKKFTRNEEKIVAEVTTKVSQAIEMILENSPEKAMAKFN